VGGTEPRIANLFRVARESRLARRLWHGLPMKHRSRLSYGYWQWNVRPADPARQESAPPKETVASLRQHYWQDEALLEQLLGVKVPWPRQQSVVS
jgi:hypothetical protein